MHDSAQLSTLAPDDEEVRYRARSRSLFGDWKTRLCSGKEGRRKRRGILTNTLVLRKRVIVERKFVVEEWRVSEGIEFPIIIELFVLMNILIYNAAEQKHRSATIFNNKWPSMEDADNRGGGGGRD